MSADEASAVLRLFAAQIEHQNSFLRLRIPDVIGSLIASGGQMRRRDFIRITLVSAAWPLAVRAQQSGMPVVGFLHSASRTSYVSLVDAFREGLKETGYVEGQNVAIEYRWAENEIARLPTLAAELVQRPISVLVAGGSPVSALSAKIANREHPDRLHQCCRSRGNRIGIKLQPARRKRYRLDAAQRRTGGKAAGDPS